MDAKDIVLPVSNRPGAVPTAAECGPGEIFINSADEKVYMGTSAGPVRELKEGTYDAGTYV